MEPIQQGLALQQQGRLAEAAALYEEVLARQADCFEALHLLSLIAVQTDKPARAVDLMDQAIAARPDQAPVYFNRGIALQQLQRHAEAAASFAQAIAIQPDHAKAYFRRGLALQALQRMADAVASFEGAIAIEPSYAVAHFNCGNALQALQRSEEALARYDAAIAVQPDYAKAYCNRGNALQTLQRTQEALASFERAIAIDPGFAEALCNRGNALRQLKRTEDAVASYAQAIGIKPHYFEAHFNLGIALLDIQRTEEALASFERAIAIQPDHAQAHFNCGIAYAVLQRVEASAASFARAISIEPKHDLAHINRGRALHELMRTQEAIASLDCAIAINPDNPVAHFYRGIVLKALQRTDDAIASYSSAIALQPDYVEANWNKSLALLQRGQFEEGWALYEWRWSVIAKSTTGVYERSKPLWLGEPSLSGKTILLHTEQGFGDTIQFCRYAKLVKARGATVLLEVPKPLLPLLGGLEGVDGLIEEGRPLPDFDVHCPLMSLPLAFGTRLETIPSRPHYLFADPEKSKLWARRLGPYRRPRVGLVWSGGFRPQQPDTWALNQRRNLPFERLGMFNGVDADFISLQKGEPAESELAAAKRSGWAGLAIADYGAELRDFSDTAALIDNLDLVISVDTSVAHLAAALGKPVWILNRYDSCWRWLQDRADSPWYPSVKLFKQARAGDWEEVMRSVRQALSAVR